LPLLYNLIFTILQGSFYDDDPDISVVGSPVTPFPLDSPSSGKCMTITITVIIIVQRMGRPCLRKAEGMELFYGLL
jgi:hypothetical protein